MTTNRGIPDYMIKAAEEYIAADRSDPFTRDRVYSHMRNGIATSHRGQLAKDDRWNWTDRDPNTGKVKSFTPQDASSPAFYSADRILERRTYQGADGEIVEYTVPAWVNLMRP